MARPRQFDEAEALQKAMRLFWERGYEGVSIADLSAAMGINKPSLYATFGDKGRLFRQAVVHYDTTSGAPAMAALTGAATARAAVEGLLAVNADAYASEEDPKGGMIVLAATVGSIDTASVRDFLKDCREEGEVALARRLRQGIEDGDLGRDTDVAGLARYFTTVLQGMSIQARDGASRAALRQVAATAMAAWPD